ncbi:MAG TPA: hypothetical protein VLA77_01690 [Candidatus Saccharimonadales bacterium]|nr:hypothetical protein [Candidatus Saccharimonadales bacterium]
MQSDILVKLLNQTWSSPVFGDSFINVNQKAVIAQIKQITNGVKNDLTKIIGMGMPELTQDQVNEIVGQIVPKTVSFCPALTAGEITDTKKLQAAATAIGVMYWGDQTMDRGDMSMPFALKRLGGQNVDVPAEIRYLVEARLEALRQIEAQIAFFAKSEDVEIVLSCFVEQVLANEVKLHELSLRYLRAQNKDKFITSNAKEIARLMVVDAGFPSVSSSLYAIYRHENARLIPLSQLYADMQITTLLQICNAVVRAADEFGDWKMDRGHDAKWGIFVINLFNQANHALINEFLSLAEIKPTLQITDAFLNFAENREKNGAFLMKVFFDHIKEHIKNLPEHTAKKNEHYILLCKRVLEIGKVNELGDIELSEK